MTRLARTFLALLLPPAPGILLGLAVRLAALRAGACELDAAAWGIGAAAVTGGWLGAVMAARAGNRSNVGQARGGPG